MVRLVSTTPEEFRHSWFQLHGVDLAGALVPLPTPTYNRLYMQHLADPTNCPDPAKTPVTPQEIFNKLVPGIIESLKDPSKSPPVVPDYFACWYMSDPKLGM
jgi:hypothetical protein